MDELLIFDLDNTLLAGDSDRNWGIFLSEQQIVDASYLDESERFYNNYYEGSLDIDGFLSFCLRPLVANDMSVLLKLRDQFIEEKIKPIVTKAGKELIDRAHSEGKKVIIGAADTFRAAAIEQLSEWADRVNVPVVVTVADTLNVDPNVVDWD